MSKWFCEGCGTQLVAGPAKVVCYSPVTGRPLYVRVLTCPNRLWGWLTFWREPHSKREEYFL